ncbi:hypothetical protein ASZ90_016733 [hydrocarbon metagenome]|uniref:Uncharacterized protein n=1 Tax=hydrocarbon metagenome TaxID=938273 RepID=A0A0W8EEW8_9ZZZZ
MIQHWLLDVSDFYIYRYLYSEIMPSSSWPAVQAGTRCISGG